MIGTDSIVVMCNVLFFYFHAQALLGFALGSLGFSGEEDNIRIHWHSKSLSFWFFFLSAMCHSCLHSLSGQYTTIVVVFGVSCLFHKFRIILHRFETKGFCYNCFNIHIVHSVTCAMRYAHTFRSLSFSLWFFFSIFFSSCCSVFHLATDQINIKISIEQTNSVNLNFFSTKTSKKKTFETNILNVQFSFFSADKINGKW